MESRKILEQLTAIVCDAVDDQTLVLTPETTKRTRHGHPSDH